MFLALPLWKEELSDLKRVLATLVPGTFCWQDSINAVSNLLLSHTIHNIPPKIWSNSAWPLWSLYLTRQRLATFTLQRDDLLRQQFVADVSLYARDTLVFIDETGTNRTDTVRRVGYSLRGKPVKAQKLVVRGEHISAIAAITRGLLALRIVRGSVDGDVFYEFVCTDLLPKLMPFSGTNNLLQQCTTFGQLLCALCTRTPKSIQ